MRGRGLARRHTFSIDGFNRSLRSERQIGVLAREHGSIEEIPLVIQLHQMHSNTLPTHCIICAL